jgi:hypothetical protein
MSATASLARLHRDGGAAPPHRKGDATVKYLSIYRPAAGEGSGQPDPEHMAAMGRLVQNYMQRGALIGTEPLAARDAGVVVSLSGGAFTVSGLDQRASGYAILNAGSREEVIQMSKDFLQVAGEGTCEVRQILEF